MNYKLISIPHSPSPTIHQLIHTFFVLFYELNYYHSESGIIFHDIGVVLV